MRKIDEIKHCDSVVIMVVSDLCFLLAIKDVSKRKKKNSSKMSAVF
jgi:hypothetical protein